MLDYFVVGMGLSGLAVTAELERQNKSFRVFEDYSQKSSLVAAGIFNPVILKRFTLAWKADEQLETALPFYRELEEKLQVKILHLWNIYRKFHSAEEQNNWFEAADKPKLSPFLSTELQKEVSPHLKSDFSFGKVLHTGNIDTDTLLKEYRHYLEKQGKISFESFDYEELKLEENELHYKTHTARKIIFCEGFGLTRNPFFNYLPLRGNKGEYITIYSEELKLEKAVKSSSFIIPLGNDLYKVGATYNHKDKSQEPTQEAREMLKEQLDRSISCSYEVVDQEAGIRPATADRRPLAGQHPEHENIFCCNGFGSRGVLIAPSLGKELVNFAENGTPLSPETDLQRFTRKYYKS